MEQFDERQPGLDDPKEGEIVSAPPYQPSTALKPIPRRFFHRHLSSALILFVSALIVSSSISWIFFNHTAPKVIKPVGPENTLSMSNDLIMSGFSVVTVPSHRSIERLNIRQGMNITVQLTSRDKHTDLSKLEAYTTDQGYEQVQQILGSHNIACVDARFDANSDELDVEPSQVQEYPLNQTTITWRWTIIPRQAVSSIFNISFYFSGKSACATDKDPIIGPYPLGSTDIVYEYTAIDPNSTPVYKAKMTAETQSASDVPDVPATQNIFVQAYNILGIGGIITTTLAALLTTFVTWICTQWWKQRKKKTNANPSPKTTRKLGQSGKKSSRRNRKKPVAVR